MHLRNLSILVVKCSHICLWTINFLPTVLSYRFRGSDSSLRSTIPLTRSTRPSSFRRRTGRFAACVCVSPSCSSASATYVVSLIDVFFPCLLRSELTLWNDVQYLAWSLAEFVSAIAGVGYVEETGKWCVWIIRLSDCINSENGLIFYCLGRNGITNNDIFCVEIPTNMRVGINNWNIGVARWINTCKLSFTDVHVRVCSA